MRPKPPKGLVQKKENPFQRLWREFLEGIDFANPLDRLQYLFCILIIAIHCWVLSTTWLDRFENIFLDYFFRQRPPLTAHPSVVLIEIAEEGLQAIGRWPWPRHYHAVITHVLSEWEARAIVFDMIFNEPSTSFDDGALKEAFEKTHQLYLPVVLEKSGKEKVWLHSLPEFEKQARGLGHINITPDPDGNLRRIQPYLEYGGQIYPHLALKLAYDYLGKKLPPVEKLSIPQDANGHIFINWAGQWVETFEHYSYWDLIRSFNDLQKGKPPLISPEKIRGKICLIGLTATGHADIKATPLEAAYPALGALANFVNSVLINKFISPAPRSLNILCLVVVGLITFPFFVPFRNWLSLLGGAFLGILWFIFSFLIFWQKGIWLYATQPLLLITSLFIFSAVYGHLVGSQEKLRFLYLATHDELTGLCVMRHFQDVFRQAVREVHKRKESLSLVMFDLDHFKKINDTHGHAAGNKVLKEVAQTIQNFVRRKHPVREPDFVARYGGEEFVILLRNSSLTDAAFTVAERIRRSVEELNIEWEGAKIPTTISAGVATLHEDERGLDSILRRADKALYKAKQEGRNRVCVEN